MLEPLQKQINREISRRRIVVKHLPNDGGRAEQQSACDLERLRREFARVMKASSGGRKAML